MRPSNKEQLQHCISIEDDGRVQEEWIFAIEHIHNQLALPEHSQELPGWYMEPGSQGQVVQIQSSVQVRGFRVLLSSGQLQDHRHPHKRGKIVVLVLEQYIERRRQVQPIFIEEDIFLPIGVRGEKFQTI